MKIKRCHMIVGYNHSGIYHDDIPPDAASSISRIVRIDISHSSFVFGIKVSWDTHASPWRGLTSSPLDTSTLTPLPDELITRVDGTIVGGWKTDGMLTSLRFYTNHGRIETYGRAIGERFTFTGQDDVNEYEASQMGLLSFETWINDDSIVALRATFAMYLLPKGTNTITSANEGKVKYEHIGDGQQGSSFLRHLACPTITLRVGTAPAAMTFYVKQDTLCQLPFFTAALHGGFKEAAEKAITMPEESPEVISALIEFLSTGSYTHSYDSDKVDKQVEGCFHVDTFMAAGKYGCGALVVEARKGFTEVLKAVEGDSSVIRLRLWRRAYEAGLRAGENWGTGQQIGGFEKRMVKSVRSVLAECKTEFEAAVKEVDGLGLDLMSIAVGLPEAE